MRNKIIEEDLNEIVLSGLPFEEFSAKTILVTGANGFLPAYLVETFLYLNETRPGFNLKVLALVRDLERAHMRFATYKDRKDLRFIVQDVADPISISEPIDCVIHAASQASPKFYGVDPVGTLSPNILGTSNLLKLARDKGCSRFLFFSSSEVYGELRAEQTPVREDSYGMVDPLQVRSCYAESKRMGETLCVSWLNQYKVPSVIVRPFHTYGPGMRLDDGRVFSDFVADVLSNRDIQMKSDGSATRAFCYLSDAIRGFFTVLLKGSPGEAYNIGNDQAEISILKLAQTLTGLYPEKNLRVVLSSDTGGGGYLKSTIARSRPDITKIKKLGWTPRYNVADGFRRTIESLSLGL